MGSKTSFTLKTVQWFQRAVQFCCCCIVLGIFSYYLATLSNHSLPISNYIRAVEGISGVGALYTALSLLLLCCLGGFGFFALFAVALDVAFVGAFAFVVWETRNGAGSCDGNVETPFGNGDANSTPTAGKDGGTALPKLGMACRLETAAFAVSVVAIAFFLLSAFVEVLLWRNHKRESRFGPSPANNYTGGSAGSKRRFWPLGSKKAQPDASYGEHPPTYPMGAKAPGGDGFVDESTMGGHGYSRKERKGVTEHGTYGYQPSGVSGEPGHY